MIRITRHAAFCALMFAMPAFAVDYPSFIYNEPAGATELETGNGVTLADGVETAAYTGAEFRFQVIFDTGDLPEPPWWDWQFYCGITTPPTYLLPLPPVSVKMAVHSQEDGPIWDCDKDPLIVPVFVDVDCPQYGPFLYWTSIETTVDEPMDHYTFELCPATGMENMPIKYKLYRLP
ncbi:MAG: hypothetical protein JXB05_21595 [Myxococcaceae bacterium]|nr:hypothetical protein [Myxococcaceae bacterium]